MNDVVTTGISVSAPGSSANLAAGFDVLGLAIDLRVDVGLGDVPDRAQMIDGHHPAMVAYQRLGGKEQLWSRSQLPMGRGLGFSGAARAAGAMLAIVEREGSADLAPVRRRARRRLALLQILRATQITRQHRSSVVSLPLRMITLRRFRLHAIGWFSCGFQRTPLPPTSRELGLNRLFNEQMWW